MRLEVALYLMQSIGQHKIEGVNIQGQLCKVVFRREQDKNKEFTKW